MDAKKILIIEDEPELASALKLRLEGEGFEVFVAHDGEDGLAMVEADPPSLIVLDIVLPGIDGYEVCTRLRADSRFRGIPVVMLTVKFQEEDIAKGFRAGADEYLTKPFEWPSLLEKVREFAAPEASVLICDDEPDLLRALETRLVSCGFNVIKAFGGEECVEKATSLRPDLVILDVMMPGMDGFQVCHRLKKELGLGMPIIMLTAKADPDDVAKGMAAGADVYLNKPFDQHDLLRNICALLESRDDEQ